MIKKFSAALAALALAAGAAHAGSVSLSATGEQATDGSVTGTYTISSAGSATLTFELDGYATLDGANSYEDDFALYLNGSATALVSGTFNLGGGGSNIYSLPAGASVSGLDNSGDIGGQGGALTFIVPIELAAGTNTFDFTYTSRTGTGFAGFQGTGDEGWGVSKVAVVPEPGSLALMLAGLGIVGGLARRRRQA